MTNPKTSPPTVSATGSSTKESQAAASPVGAASQGSAGSSNGVAERKPERYGPMAETVPSEYGPSSRSPQEQDPAKEAVRANDGERSDAGAAASAMSIPAQPESGASRDTGVNRKKLPDALQVAKKSMTDAASRGARRARLELKKVDPWSVMKFSFAASLVLFITFVVASAILYTILDVMGVFNSINETVQSLTATNDETGREAINFRIDAPLVIGGAALLGAVNMVLFTALGTLGAFIYNVCSDLTGGIELTLAERD